MTTTPISYGEYAATLAAIGAEGRDALEQLEQAHDAVRDALRTYLRARGDAYDRPEVQAAKAAGERDAKVDAFLADHKATLEHTKLRVEALNASLREIRSRRQSGDELARFARRQLELDTPGPDVAVLARRAA